MADNNFRINTQGGTGSTQTNENVKLQEFDNFINLSRVEQNNVKKESDLNKVLGLNKELEEQKLVSQSIVNEEEIYNLRKEEELIIEEEKKRINDLRKKDKEDKFKKDIIYDSVSSGVLSSEEALTEAQTQGVMLDKKIVEDVADKRNSINHLNNYKSEENIQKYIDQEKKLGTFVSVSTSIENYKNDLRENVSDSNLSLSYKNSFFKNVDGYFNNNKSKLISADEKDRNEKLKITAVQSYNDAVSNSKERTTKDIFKDLNELTSENEMFGMTKSEISEILVTQIREEASLSNNVELLEDFKKYSYKGVHPYKLFQSQIDRDINEVKNRKIKQNEVSRFKVDETFITESNISSLMDEASNKGAKTIEGQFNYAINKYNEVSSANVEGYNGKIGDSNLKGILENIKTVTLKTKSKESVDTMFNKDLNMTDIESKLDDSPESKKYKSYVVENINKLQNTHYSEWVTNQNDESQINLVKSIKLNNGKVSKEIVTSMNNAINKSVNSVDGMESTQVDSIVNNANLMKTLRKNGIKISDNEKNSMKFRVFSTVLSRNTELGDNKTRVKNALSYMNVEEDLIVKSRAKVGSEWNDEILKFSNGDLKEALLLKEIAARKYAVEGDSFDIDDVDFYKRETLTINGNDFLAEGSSLTQKTANDLVNHIVESKQGVDNGLTKDNIFFKNDAEDLSKIIIFKRPQVSDRWFSTNKHSNIQINSIDANVEISNMNKKTKAIEKVRQDRNRKLNLNTEISGFEKLFGKITNVAKDLEEDNDVFDSIINSTPQSQGLGILDKVIN
jgi:hypothetical protein